MKRKDVERFEKIIGQLEGAHKEIGALLKKSPNDGVNKFKLRLINKVIEDANSLLGSKHRPFEDFSIFDENTLPSNSDTAFILAQYINCMENLRVENIKQGNFAQWYWVIDNELSSEKTAPPKKLNRR